MIFSLLSRETVKLNVIHNKKKEDDMVNKSTRSLILAASLIVIPTSFQTAFAAGLSSLATSSLEKVTATTTSAQEAANASVEKVNSTTSSTQSAVNANLDKAKSATSMAKTVSTTTSANSIPTLSINTATAEQLAMIPGISTSIAETIIEYRDTYGNFTNLTSLTSIEGIDASTLTKILPYLSL
jgi:competence ComEA-like helix-hairpin-helix protein